MDYFYLCPIKNSSSEISQLAMFDFQQEVPQQFSDQVFYVSSY